MLQIHSNGRLFSRLLSLHWRSLHLYSTSTSTTKASPNSSLVDYLVNSLGFSNQEAIATSLKVRSLNSNRNPNSVVHFFKLNGCTDTHIKKIVSRNPTLLRCDVEKTLNPKIRVLQNLGLSGSDLGKFLADSSQILRRKLTTQIVPAIEFLTPILGTKENVVKALRTCRGWFSIDVATRNHAVFRNYGIPNEMIQKFLVQYPTILGVNSNKLEDACGKVEDKFRIPVDSSAFLIMVYLLTTLTSDNLHLKYQAFKSYGWSESDIHTLIRKLPFCLGLSEVRIRSKLEFLMKNLCFEAGYIASHPILLTCSLEKRVVRRNAVLQILKQRKLVSVSTSLYGALSIAESRFLNRFVRRYEYELPGLLEAYSNNEMDSFSQSC